MPSDSVPCSPTKSRTTSRSGATGQVLHGRDLAAVGQHGVVRPELLRPLEHVGATGRRPTTSAGVIASRHCRPMWPSPPAPIITTRTPG